MRSDMCMQCMFKHCRHQFSNFWANFLTLKWKQAGAELCQAHGKLEVVVEIGVEFEACHY